MGGLIGYLGLQEWWLSEFTEAERDHIEKNGFGKPTLTHGVIQASSHTPHSLIMAMTSFWQPTAEDERLIVKLIIKAHQIGG
ncbi:hypothetical protein [Methylomonas fluvii]|uniref:Uncharacterized protein n=1 Tax=Methylomonas fluvii TaxID=1854564 RepID=A0ABR9DIP5_9GAMM|nr:hypothetical protein [Methylomonas fluvii]MBD9362930.1 hypothetical protein [Methylomonas fluvii]CAD6876115.1 hypothetical protein [Methylomonas fluvii]